MTKSYENQANWTKCQEATPEVQQELEALRHALRQETLSYGEAHRLAELADYIPLGDTELLEAAGVPEYAEEVEVDAPYMHLMLPEPSGWWVQVKMDDEGIVLDIMNEWDEVVRTTWKTYTEFGKAVTSLPKTNTEMGE